MGPLSTVVGAAIVHAIQIEAAALLVKRGEKPPVLASANLDTTSQDDLDRTLARYAGRIRYLDVRRRESLRPVLCCSKSLSCSVNDALEAERGGAGRLEVVRELAKAGSHRRWSSSRRLRTS